MYSKESPQGEFVAQSMMEFKGLDNESLFRRVRVMTMRNVTVENATDMARTLRDNNPHANLITKITVWI
jgi:hypothetical protein